MLCTFVQIMRVLRKTIYFLLLFLLVGVVAILIYLASQKPHYNGSLKLNGLKEQVEVIYDFYGIPHIYAASEEDAYFALGYVHAQDRLFQMEMTRRVASGRLSEILGVDFVQTDAFFKTLGLKEHADASAMTYLRGDSLPFQRSAKAYLAGVNSFIETGTTPVEFTMLGIEKELYKEADLLLSSEYMAFNFAMAFRTDPLMSFIQSKLGRPYLTALVGGFLPGTRTIPVNVDTSVGRDSRIASAFSQHSVPAVLDRIPVPPITGSNGWVVAPSRSQSGKVMVGNDTHIGFGQPAIWYEAHLEYPGFSFYGNYLPGLPFAALGHSRNLGWGLTMLENDDVDFYALRIKPGDSTLYWSDGRWAALKRTVKTIKVKGEEDRELIVEESHQGPLVHRVMPEWQRVTDGPVAMMWTHLRFMNNLIPVTYGLNHARNMQDFRSAVSSLISPGLNVMYGDNDGNIAWWAAGRLVKRSVEVNPLLLIDGSRYNLDPSGYYDFSSNPHAVNPPEGIVFSANHQPDSMPGMGFYPGYYVPEDRAVRIEQLFAEKNKFNVEDLQRIGLDTRSPVTPKVSEVIMSSIRSEVKQKSSLHASAAKLLLLWDGSHDLRDQGPVIYYKLLYHILQSAMEDELGEENFKVFLGTHVLRSSVLPLVQNDSTVWWNDVNTRDVVESRNMIFEKAFDRTVEELTQQLGSNTDSWEWGRVHILEHKHPIGMKEPFNIIFNVGPYAVPGGQEVINQFGFDLSGDGMYKVRFGPAMRILYDFADIDNAKGILPTGQSGNLMSRYYYDQAIMYNTGKMRKQKMNRAEIESNRSGRLTLEPR
jgi:penicillin amidase